MLVRMAHQGGRGLSLHYLCFDYFSRRKCTSSFIDSLQTTKVFKTFHNVYFNYFHWIHFLIFFLLNNSFLSQEIRNRFDRFAESVLQTIIALLSNSAKVMATSGVVAMRFILEVSKNLPKLPSHYVLFYRECSRRWFLDKCFSVSSGKSVHCWKSKPILQL